MRSSKHSHARGHRAKSKQKDNSKEFDKYYSGVYGARWASLRDALLKTTVHAAVANSFILPSATAASSDAGLVPLVKLGALHSYRRAKSAGPYPPPPLDPHSALRVWYWLDLASVLPVLLLQPRRGQTTLEMCAAPGRKSVMVAQRLFEQQPSAVAPAAQSTPRPHAVVETVSASAATEPLTSSSGSESARGPGPDAPEAAAARQQALQQAVSEPSSCSEGDPEVVQRPQEETPRDATGTGDSDPAAGIRPATATAAAAAGEPPPGSSEAAGLPSSCLPLPRLPLPPGKLVCNEPDRQRLQRLQRVLEEYLPLSARANVEVLNYQGHAYWGRNQAASYDRVLVDAPCSSDRHVLHQAEAQQRGAIGAADWSLASCRRIADEQLQLCLAAMRALRVGGRLVYSTCSIAPLQNDEVVERLLRRCGPEAARVLPALEVLQRVTAEAATAAVAGDQGGGPGVAEVLGVEATQHGAICLPDRGGWGPIYVAVVEKVGEVAGMGAVAMLRPQPTGHSDEEDEEEEQEGSEGGEDDQ